ncbi:MAG: hypothetical protein LC744_01770 [Chloroflexi bacterium]|nr:hypothetical protein [Chloroflexota bacterium]
MTAHEEAALVGAALSGTRGVRIGRVEAIFADYLLVRTPGALPIDLYVPRPSVTEEARGLTVDCGPAEARRRWHRPLRRAPHD